MISEEDQAWAQRVHVLIGKLRERGIPEAECQALDLELIKVLTGVDLAATELVEVSP
jgi:hypothetical protein